MPAVRLMPTQESADLIELTRDLADKELRPLVGEAERAHAYLKGDDERSAACSGQNREPGGETMKAKKITDSSNNQNKKNAY